VSGAGWIAGFADKLIRTLHALRITDEDIHKLASDTPDGELMVNRIASIIRTFTLVSLRAVKVQASRTAQLVDDDIRKWMTDVAMNEDTFELSGEILIPGRISSEVELVCVTVNISDLLHPLKKSDIDAIFLDLGLRHAGVVGLMMLSAALDGEFGDFYAYNDTVSGTTKCFGMGRGDPAELFHLYSYGEGVIFGPGSSFVGVRKGF